MSVFRSHYEVLGVARSASDEVIRAAYRVLSQKYHPDRNPRQPQQAHRAMTELNEAYAVLSDPDRRWEYDLWLARRQLQAQVSPHSLVRQQNGAAPRLPASAPPALADDTVTLPTRHHAWVWFLVVAVVLVMGGVWWKMLRPEPAPALPAGMVSQAPNGQAFPNSAGYVAGYPLLHERGGNVIRVDNSGLNTAVFAQLFELRRDQFTAIRSFYLPAGAVFSLRKIGDGDFSLHYQRLDNGSWQVSDAIQISHTERSRQYRDIDIHL